MIKERVIKAYNFAKEAHEGQVRKYSELPYFSHPKGVARILEELHVEDDLIITALLHDVVEDTSLELEDILREFGERVASLVNELTSDKDSSRKIGKDIYLAHKLRNMSEDALLIKLADRFHNILYLQEDNVPLEFIKKYVCETEFILTPLKNLTPNQIILYSKINAVLDFLKIRHSFN